MLRRFTDYFAPSHFDELPPLIATTRLILAILFVTSILLMADDWFNGSGANTWMYLVLTFSTSGALALTFRGYFLLPRLVIPFIVLWIVTYAIFKNEMGLHDYAMQSEQKFRSIAEQIQDVIFITDQQGTITYISPSCAVIFGWPAEEMLNRPFSFFLTERDIPLALEEFQHTVTTPQSQWGLSLYMKRQNGDEFVGDLHAAPLRQEGVVCGTIGLIRDITERQRAEEQIRAALQEKDILLREIHHRVKNNMQVISSLLNLQSHLFPDTLSKKLFQESRQRIRSMALIHEKLYQAKDLSSVNFGEYVSTLVHELYASYSTLSEHVDITVDMAEVVFGIDIAIPCGLIINELVSNTLKYAFPNRTGRLAITLTAHRDRGYELEIRDNGVGMPEDFDIDHTKTLGLQLVKGLVEEQLDGTFELHSQPGGGTLWLITFS